MLKQEEKVIQPHAERIEVVIPSTAEVRKKKLEPLQRRVESRMVALLKEHVDAFTWSCRDMPGRIPMSLCTSYHGKEIVL